MKRRSLVAMTDDEQQQFLEGDGYTLQLATIGPDGAPHLAAMWYGVDGGQICFNTYLTSQKALNIARDPRVTCMIESGRVYEELRGVVVQGVAQLVEDRAEVLRISARIGARYPAPAPRAASTGSTGRTSAAPSVAAKRGVYRVLPTSVYSWDHRKLPQGVH